MGLDGEILRHWAEFCDDLAKESRTIHAFFSSLDSREEFIRISRSHNWRIDRNPDLPVDDPWQEEGRHSLFRLYLGRTSHYIVTCASQPKDDDGRPDVTEVLTHLAASALSEQSLQGPQGRGDPYFMPMPRTLQRPTDSEDWIFAKSLRLPLLVARRFEDELGRFRWEIMAQRLRQLRPPSPTSLVHSREWWQMQHRRLQRQEL